MGADYYICNTAEKRAIGGYKKRWICAGPSLGPMDSEEVVQLALDNSVPEPQVKQIRAWVASGGLFEACCEYDYPKIGDAPWEQDGWEVTDMDDG
jgi:hypothetical protein